ncbi:MAG: DUF4843 domain-containing protein [Bacteroidales bacterium]|jgi:hypothetical protein|nr:DUF4843 domain-containing protein [Bacteroidales bacterium]MDD2424419.1 DUF4843 domain-containing protein [Bacteroidales bacterium]MDD3989001.1 DUF4843 domain-containing protein [Bacteroidales bacterium]MDD4638390.1 DUF4843 domain-containing protein [Bacteroidales bacterium]
MKKIVFILTAIVSIVTLSCENESSKLYNGEPAIYFSNLYGEKDSVTYSFIGKNKELDTVFLNVKLLGYVQDTPKKIKVRLIPEMTTAVAEVHYTSLQQEYEFPSNTYEYQLPVIINKHPDLNDNLLIIALELIENDDFKIAFPNRVRARVMFSNIIMKPAIWDAILAPVFGVYSRTKHEICMDLTGRPFPETTQDFNIERNVWRNFGWLCNSYFADNIVMDNDLVPPVRILPWF